MGATPNRIAELARQHPTAIRQLESRAIQEAARPLAQALTAAQQEATAHWLRATASQRPPSPGALDQLVEAIKQLLARAFRNAGAQARRTAERAALNAALLGAEQAAHIARTMRDQPTPNARPQPPGWRGSLAGPQAQAAADSLPAAIEEEHHHALALLTAAGLTALGLAGLTTVFNRARRAVTRIARAVAVAVTSGAAAGATTVARAIGPAVRLLWVAEPGACEACAAYAGRSVLPGRKFPGGLSLNPKRTVFPTPIYGPPRHPHCRCALIPWLPEWHTGGTPLPDLLRQRTSSARRP
ncbi:hypothetical protein [Streptomyces sp. NPDC005953]|uniref:hypothetical protein n=1 Tax=Streptomyces sp. NPDC005953 TaxID=3156719 RepID=UPI0033C0B993